MNLERRSKAKEITIKQVVNYGWQGGPGTIYLNRVKGRTMWTDRLGALWNCRPGSRTKLQEKKKQRLILESDGYVYLTKNGNDYKLRLF